MWLDDLVAATKDRLGAGYYRRRPPEFQSPTLDPSSLAEAIQGHEPAVLAEIKPARPSGASFDVDVEEQARRYAQGGACGISVLTDPDHFGGGLENLQKAQTTGLPVLMKDFLVDPAQIEAARAWGASAILAIARLSGEGYTDYTLEQAVKDAHAQGLEVLAEVVTEAELDRALAAGADVVGINVRDLDTLEVDPTRVERLLRGRSLSVPVLHLSGIETPGDLDEAMASGVDGALIGTALMDAEDPVGLLCQLRGGDRE